MSKVYKAKRTGTKVVTGMVRLSYAHLHEPYSIEGNEPKYSAALIIPKSDKLTIKAIKEAIEEAKELGKSKWNGKIPANLKIPLRDGDAERPDDDTYADAYFVNANSKRKPDLVDLKGNTDLGTDEVYSGCYALECLSISLVMQLQVIRVLAAGLGNVQKLDDGDPLGGFTRAEDDFEFEDDDGDGFLD